MPSNDIAYQSSGVYFALVKSIYKHICFDSIQLHYYQFECYGYKVMK